MKPPTHLTTSAPQDTFRYIAAWADNAAEVFEEIDSEYDPDSDRARWLRDQATECCAHIFAAVVLAPPEARSRLGKGLDRAQRTVDPVAGPPLF